MTGNNPPQAHHAEIDYLDWAAEHLKGEWRVSKSSLYTRYVSTEHLITLPNTLECPPLIENLIVMSLTEQSRQVNRFDGGEYDGVEKPGEFCLLPSGLSGTYYWEAPAEALVLTIHPKELQRVAVETECLNPDRVELRSVLLDRDPQIEAIARSFYSEMKQTGIGGQLYSESLANILNIHLLRHYCTQPITLRRYESGLSQHSLQQVLDYIHSHLERDLSLDTLSNLANMSKYHFIYLFKQSKGMTPHQYVIQQRIHRAKEMLGDRKLAISGIGLACGFANQSHFTRLFRKHTGVAPKAYRDR
ncbi:helix-turn-helix domain-containing protein [Leptolyngbya sp. GGD]|uniref:helix-turn-helix domain-containing protein n=1 Tax=Leptolyngbya sp. GGD TaxID=2997907 RepID=UPI00227A4A2E|nr:AraC family transcriptional regulator [Leptolyngbya sp. GGD]MCY6490272.1 AraC family transcriptional regulator [Leptolyngbya sp. GGD]